MNIKVIDFMAGVSRTFEVTVSPENKFVKLGIRVAGTDGIVEMLISREDLAMIGKAVKEEGGKCL